MGTRLATSELPGSSTQVMCYYVLVGAKTEAFRLRDVLSADGVLDTELPADSSARGRFPEQDAVVCVTLEGCSCALLETPLVGKTAQQHKPQREAFHGALSRAIARFGSIRLLVLGGGGSADAASSHLGTTSALRELLALRRPSVGPMRVVA